MKRAAPITPRLTSWHVWTCRLVLCRGDAFVHEERATATAGPIGECLVAPAVAAKRHTVVVARLLTAHDARATVLAGYRSQDRVLRTRAHATEGRHQSRALRVAFNECGRALLVASVSLCRTSTSSPNVVLPLCRRFRVSHQRARVDPLHLGHEAFCTANATTRSRDVRPSLVTFSDVLPSLDALTSLHLWQSRGGRAKRRHQAVEGFFRKVLRADYLGVEAGRVHRPDKGARHAAIRDALLT